MPSVWSGRGRAVATYQGEEFDLGWRWVGAVCLHRTDECCACLLCGGLDVSSVIDIFHLHGGIISSEAGVKPTIPDPTSPSREAPGSVISA